MKSIVRSAIVAYVMLVVLGTSAEAQFTGFVKPLDCANYTGTKADYGSGYATLYRDTENNNHNYYEGMGSHPGVDISRLSNGTYANGTPIRAIYGGWVAKVYSAPQNNAYNGGWGYCVVIRHEGIPDAGTIFSCYAHMSRFEKNWARDNWINKGDVIGYVGNTGNSTGPHLHFQIDRDYGDYYGGLHPFFPANVNAPDSNGDVLNHTINPMRFVQDHSSPIQDNVRIDTSRLYVVVASHSGKVLDVEGGPSATAAGVPVQQWDFWGGANQLWRFQLVEGGQYYNIVAVHSGKCLDVTGGSMESGAGVIQWDCHGGDNQKWKLLPGANGGYVIQAKHSGKVLDVAGGSMDNGARVIQWDAHGGANQLWLLAPQ